MRQLVYALRFTGRATPASPNGSVLTVAATAEGVLVTTSRILGLVSRRTVRTGLGADVVPIRKGSLAMSDSSSTRPNSTATERTVGQHEGAHHPMRSSSTAPVVSRRTALGLVALAALLALAGPVRHADAGDQVPFWATLEVVDTLYTDGCPSICFSGTGSGTATHLGNITSTGAGVVISATPADPTHLVFTSSEVHTLTGANGDSITLAGTTIAIQDLETGAVVVPPWSYTITGGTGRYAGATGSGMTEGTLQLNAAGTELTGAFTFTGSISSVGSPRSTATMGCAALATAGAVSAGGPSLATFRPDGIANDTTDRADGPGWVRSVRPVGHRSARGRAISRGHTDSGGVP